MLVDHNVKSVAALVDRVLAMYLGEEIVTGRAEDVMKNETVRRVYLGGTISDFGTSRSRASKINSHCFRLRMSAFTTARLRRWKTSRSMCMQGEFVSVVGLNGAGKTTLFNTVSGLLPYTGNVIRDGEDLRGKSPAKIARSGVVHCPETRELFGEMTVRENLDLGGQHLDEDSAGEAARLVVRAVPILKQRQGQMAQTLSGGEQQMLAIGRALMMQPRILILDEPTLGLAPIILEQLVQGT